MLKPAFLALNLVTTAFATTFEVSDCEIYHAVEACNYLGAVHAEIGSQNYNLPVAINFALFNKSIDATNFRKSYKENTLFSKSYTALFLNLRALL